MPTRFNIYFNEEEEPLLEEAKRRIDNLSEFFKNILREHLQIAKNVPETPTEVQRPDAGVIFQKKFADFETEADIRTVFEDRIGAEQALKNRLIELRRVNNEQFGDVCRLFAGKYPGYAKILEEL